MTSARDGYWEIWGREDGDSDAILLMKLPKRVCSRLEAEEAARRLTFDGCTEVEIRDHH